MKNNIYGDMLIGKKVRYSLDTHETGLNNNVLVVGTSGAGKTTGIVIPNLLEMAGSYVICDPKGSLYRRYGDYMREHGYQVRRLSFFKPEESCGYNFFSYIRSSQDVQRMAHMLVCGDTKAYKAVDPFWEQARETLLSSIIGYLYVYRGPGDQNMKMVTRMLENCEYRTLDSSMMDKIMGEVERKDPESFVCHQYRKVRCAAERTWCSVVVTLQALFGRYDIPKVAKMLEVDQVDIRGIGREKTALFVEVSDTDRSMDMLANVFFTQVMQELCKYADEQEDGRLPVDVRFFLDDFATNCKIVDFPKMIASIRSRGISAVLMLQAESQLIQMYGDDGRTIIGNCDTYVYLGGNDIETAMSVSSRTDKPLTQILEMPVRSMWIFRRGQAPRYEMIWREFDRDVMDAER